MAPVFEIRRADEADRAQIARLLNAASLPLAGFDERLEPLLVAVVAGSVAGGVALERYGADALLRSLVVAPEHRGAGVGERLVEAVLAEARASGVATVWLLTTTAERFFPRFGFAAVERRELPASLAASEELRGACPASAIAMRRAVGD